MLPSPFVDPTGVGVMLSSTAMPMTFACAGNAPASSSTGSHAILFLLRTFDHSFRRKQGVSDEEARAVPVYEFVLISRCCASFTPASSAQL
jgi:hypothetical protein